MKRSLCVMCLIFMFNNFAFAADTFLHEIELGMSKDAVKKLGAQKCADSLCMESQIGEEKLATVFNFQKNKLINLAMFASNQDYDYLHKAIIEAGFVQVYVEVDSENCDYTELVRTGYSQEQIMEKIDSLAAKQVRAQGQYVSFYTKQESLDLLLEKKELLENADIVAPNSQVIILSGTKEDGLSLVYSTFYLLSVNK